MTSPKAVDTIVLDAGPMLKNDPSISSLLGKAALLVTVPAVLSEIRDATARSRIETTWKPFLHTKTPRAESVKIVTDFARRTGDLAVLSKPDLEILAITYELEAQKKGTSNIRVIPGQPLPKAQPLSNPEKNPDSLQSSSEAQDTFNDALADRAQESGHGDLTDDAKAADEPGASINSILESIRIAGTEPNRDETVRVKGDPNTTDVVPEQENSDSDGWITPANIQRHQAKDGNAAVPISTTKSLDVACLTSDFAMQNVLLSMNLSLLNASLQRVRHIKTFILRCHACFGTTKEMSKQFCPRCGKPTLTRVTCSTNSRGEFRMHLKKNMQWNHRGDRFSIPKPVSGTANGKASQGRGGGKNGWGQSLILAEDQKEYLRAINGQGRKKETDLMDQDYLPGILTGERGRSGGRSKVGAGRNINARKR
ncbi:MAG: hypothetical protein Q9222_003580 [Ikaeria aurantiellina]